MSWNLTPLGSPNTALYKELMECSWPDCYGNFMNALYDLAIPTAPGIVVAVDDDLASSDPSTVCSVRLGSTFFRSPQAWRLCIAGLSILLVTWSRTFACLYSMAGSFNDA